MKKQKKNNLSMRDNCVSGLWISSSTILDNRLSWIEKCLYSYISTSIGSCSSSNEEMSVLFNISQSSVSKYLSRLKDYGLIEEVSFDGRARRISPKCNNQTL